MSTLSSITAPAPSGAAAPTATRPEFTDIGDPTKIASQSLSFDEFLSAINPLQHIPVVGTIYRAITGDTILPAARVLGSALISGPIGLITSAADAILEQSTGKDMASTVLAAIGLGHDGASPPPAQYAAASPADGQPSPADTSAPTVAQDASASTAAAATAPTSAAAAATTAATSAPVAPATANSLSAAPAPLAARATTGAPPSAPLFTANGKSSGAGWTLADYQTFAGHGMPAASNGPLRNNAVPLQTTVPIGNEIGQAAIVPAVARQPAMAAVPAGASAGDSPASSGSPENWMAQAMIRGLDRYRQMKKAQDQGPQPSIDGSF